MLAVMISPLRSAACAGRTRLVRRLARGLKPHPWPAPAQNNNPVVGATGQPPPAVTTPMAASPAPMISGPTTGRRSRTVDRACVQATLVVAKPMAYAVKISPRVQWREPQAGLEVQGEADQKSCVAGHPQRHGD